MSFFPSLTTERNTSSNELSTSPAPKTEIFRCVNAIIILDKVISFAEKSTLFPQIFAGKLKSCSIIFPAKFGALHLIYSDPKELDLNLLIGAISFVVELLNA